MDNNAAYWISRLNMHPHPEGGFYKETFRSEATVQRTSDHAVKSACTSIYYLLENEDHSAFHRIRSDEIWYFHKGAPLNIYVIDADGKLQTFELSDSESGTLSLVVTANLWFAAEVKDQKGFTLVSCAVAPGFDFAEFEIADADERSKEYPDYKELIKRLSKNY